MLKDLFSILNAPVPPGTLHKNPREPVDPANLLEVPLVPSVPPEKTKNKTESTNTTIREPKEDSSRLNPKHRAAILRWLHFIGENSQPIIDDVLDYCAGNPDALAYYLKRSREIK
ncbi:MAG: hypothetical protein ACXWTP_02640 [Methylosarcina sp.]